MCRSVRVGGFTLSLREGKKNRYTPYTMTSNDANWKKGWFYLRNTSGWPPTYTGKVLTERPGSRGRGVTDPMKLELLELLTGALCSFADRGLTVAVVIANFHLRRVVPLMSRPLPIFAMTASADPAALAATLMSDESFPRAYAAKGARRDGHPQDGLH